MANGNDMRLTYKQALQWIVPVLLGALVTGMIAIWGKLESIQTDLRTIDTRLVAVESNRFTSSDGLAVWRELDNKVNRDDLNATIQRIELILDEIRQSN